LDNRAISNSSTRGGNTQLNNQFKGGNAQINNKPAVTNQAPKLQNAAPIHQAPPPKVLQQQNNKKKDQQ
jgi:hypothetical protein